MLGILNEILSALRRGDVPAIGAATTRNFRQPIQSIIPWATNYFTETLIERVQAGMVAGAVEHGVLLARSERLIAEFQSLLTDALAS